MIKKTDSERLAKYFPDADWEELFWGFTCYSRQNYASTVQLEAVDEIMLGIQHPEGSCLCELGISWHLLDNKLVPQLHVYSESWHLLNTPTFQLVLNLLTKEKEPLPTPDEVSMLLIEYGFIDQSDQPLDGTPLVVD